jgi:2-polyprenyl-6-methoxyphenol hydroxylase-like FAD-dependent oxidoreductase
MTQRIIVIGGGIGGLTAGLALRTAGIDTTVYERSAAFSETGAGMSLWPNATRVLSSLGVLKALVELGQTLSSFRLQRTDGSTISTISMEGFATPSLCIHRADLHRVLRESLPRENLVAGHRLEDFTWDGDTVRARFSSGAVANADALVGADGIRSAVRAILHGGSDPVYRGYRIWRGLAPMVPGIALGSISETWGKGQRFGIMPIGRGRVCWYATMNGPSLRSGRWENAPGALGGLFRDWHRPVAELIGATDPASILCADAQDRSPLGTWGRGPVTLLGDAAHPMTPNVGQGACMAIEDASCLARCLTGGATATRALRSYERLRMRRTSMIVRQARAIGYIGQLSAPWTSKIRDALTGLVLSVHPDSRLNAVYGFEA